MNYNTFDFRFVWILEHQFAARTEKIYPSPVKTEGSKIKIKSTVPPASARSLAPTKSKLSRGALSLFFLLIYPVIYKSIHLRTGRKNFKNLHVFLNTLQRHTLLHFGHTHIPVKRAVIIIVNVI